MKRDTEGRVNELTWQGLPVILSVYLTEAGDPVTVRRSWRSRLFSRPWRPWQATYTYTPQVPYRGFVQVEHGFVVHPATWRRLRQTLGDR